jgi:putative DNA primase/helicase
MNDGIGAAEQDRLAVRGADHGSENTDAQFMVPEALRKRFLKERNKYFFRDEGNRLAFEDAGKRLVTDHNSPEVARSMVELAQAKGWSTIRLKGTEEFKREAWLQASLNGMQIEGFQPRDADRARLTDARKERDRTAERGLNSISHVPERMREASAKTQERAQSEAGSAVVDEHQRTLSGPQRTAVEAIKVIMRSRGDSDSAVAMAAEIAAERFQNNRVYVGKLVEHGAVPFENNPQNEQSYYVTLKTKNGEKVLWGVDLARTVSDGGAKAGDDVVLAYQGRVPVTVQLKVRNEHGRVVGEKSIATNRNAWNMRRLDSLREEAKERLAAAAQNALRQPVVRVYDRNAPSAEPRPEFVRRPAREIERVRT